MIRFPVLAPIAVCILACAAVITAQNPPSVAGGPAPGRGPGRRGRVFDPALVARGKTAYSTSCGFCHGLDARGGDGGPDLARSLVVMEDDNGGGLGDLLRAGRIDKGMPAFPGLTPAQITDIATYLHERVEAARSSAAKAAGNILVGNAQAGAAYFSGAGKCNTCHSTTGDLKGIASRYDPMALQDKFVNPRGGGGRGSGAPAPGTLKTVRVTLSNGQTVSGTLIYISEFVVTLTDAGGQRRSFSRSGSTPKIEVKDPLQAHLDLMLRYTDKDIHDLTAFLATLK